MVWLMSGDSVLSQPTIDPEPDTNWEIVGTGDFTGKGQTDILWRNKTTGHNRVWLMNGLTDLVPLP